MSNYPNIKIDPEFRSLIPPLRDEERTQLEENLKRDGCRDPLATWKGLLIDGHNRHEICGRLGIEYRTIDIELADRDAAKVWIIRNQFGRRNLQPFQRAELVMVLKPLIAEKGKEKQEREGRELGGTLCQKSDKGRIDTKRELASISGLSHDTIHKAGVIAARAPESAKQKLRTGEATINGVYRDIKKSEQKAEKAKAKAVVPDDLPAITERYRLFNCDLSAAADIADNSVDWIITDPPYPKEFLSVYDQLSAFAARVLKPGGGLLVMVGQSYLPDIILRLSSRMAYHWTLAYLTPGGQSVQLWERKVNTFWKPVLWFVKGQHVGDWIGDVSRSDVNDNDKRFHGWGQSESGMADLVERFTFPGQTICDPLCGGGTTGVVAVKMNRLFIGVDIDVKAIKTTKARLADVQRE